MLTRPAAPCQISGLRNQRVAHSNTLPGYFRCHLPLFMRVPFSNNPSATPQN